MKFSLIILFSFWSGLILACECPLALKIMENESLKIHAKKYIEAEDIFNEYAITEISDSKFVFIAVVSKSKVHFEGNHVIAVTHKLKLIHKYKSFLSKVTVDQGTSCRGPLLKAGQTYMFVLRNMYIGSCELIISQDRSRAFKILKTIANENS